MNLTPSMGLGTVQPVCRLETAPAIPVRRMNTTKHDLAGYGTLRTILEFSKWACEQDRFPTIDAVCARFYVCRATAYRWTSALAETYGIDPPPRAGPEAR